MKLQFTTKSLLWITAFVAVWIGGVGWHVRPFVEYDGLSSILGPEFAVKGPIWVPWIFLAYALGRRTFTWRIVFAFAIAEVAANAASHFYLGMFYSF